MMSQSTIGASGSIAVLGAGSWGTALAIQLARAGATVKLWGRDTEALAQMRKAGVNERYLSLIHISEPTRPY